MDVFLRSLQALVFVLSALALTGCYSLPAKKVAVAAVEVEGTHDIDDDELKDKLATRATRQLFGLFYGVYEYEIYDRFALRRDLQRVERYLRARGYYDARVYAARVQSLGNKVRVTVEVVQGEPVMVGEVEITGDAALDDRAKRSLRSRISDSVPKDGIFDEDKFEQAQADALRTLTTHGFAGAKIERAAEVNLATRHARLSFNVESGPTCYFGEVKFEGLGDLSEAAVRRVFDIDPGDLYSSDDIDEGRQALLDLGVFAGVTVEPDLSQVGKTNVVPLVVKAEPSKLRTITVGGGAEFDTFKTDSHLTFGWSNANFLGGLRKIDITYKPGMVLYPLRISNVVAPEKILYEHRFRTTVRQPALIERRTTGFVTGEYNIYPVLLPDPTVNVLGYHEVRGEAGFERKFQKVLVRPEYAISANFPFDYVGTTSGVENVLVSYAEIRAHYDLRDDPIRPRRGLFIGNNLQLAGGPLSGSADDVRIEPEVRAFVPLPKKLVFAIRGGLGFLFPFNYAQASQANFESPGPSRVEGTSRDYQILFFRGFFGGGPSSNRGYPLRAVGPYDFIPYLSPAGQSISAGACDPTDRSAAEFGPASDPQCKLPTGGLTKWEASAEVRIPITGPLLAAVFCDAGDVSPLQLDIRLNHMHLSCGAGARYDTPVGPIRFDVGYRIPGLQYPTNAFGEQQPDLVFGVLPIAIAFAIGESF